MYPPSVISIKIDIEMSFVACPLFTAPNNYVDQRSIIARYAALNESLKECVQLGCWEEAKIR